MRNEKKIPGFSYYKNIANFEAFWWDKNFSKNLYCNSFNLCTKKGAKIYYTATSINLCTKK